MKSKMAKAAKEREKKVNETVSSVERRELLKMKQTLRNSEKLLNIISVQN